MLMTYPDQLKLLAESGGIELKDAFEKAGIPSSTYYRSLKGPRNMTFETAQKVARAIEQLAQS